MEENHLEGRKKLIEQIWGFLKIKEERIGKKEQKNILNKKNKYKNYRKTY